MQEHIFIIVPNVLYVIKIDYQLLYIVMTCSPACSRIGKSKPWTNCINVLPYDRCMKNATAGARIRHPNDDCKNCDFPHKSSDSSNLLWLWIVLGVITLIILTFLTLYIIRKKKKTHSAGWRASRLTPT